MHLSQSEFGAPHPDASPELARFAFLIGKWRCIAHIDIGNGTRNWYPATWIGRWALDGFAIEDEFRMSSLTGDLIVLGVNFRTFDAARRRWNIRWLSALSGEWTDLCSDEFGGAHFGDNCVSYVFREPMAHHAFTRATYTVRTPDHFTWTGERSSDLASWCEFMLVDCHRLNTEH